MLNRATLIGNVGSDPETRTIPGGAVVSFSLATSEKWKDKQGQKQEKTQWHRLTAFGKLAEIIGQYVKKGSRLYVEGRIEYQEYEKDGVKRYSTQIVVNEMKMLGDSGGGSSQAPQQQRAPAQAAADDFDDDIPF